MLPLDIVQIHSHSILYVFVEKRNAKIELPFRETRWCPDDDWRCNEDDGFFYIRLDCPRDWLQSYLHIRTVKLVVMLFASCVCLFTRKTFVNNFTSSSRMLLWRDIFCISILNHQILGHVGGLHGIVKVKLFCLWRR